MTVKNRKVLVIDASIARAAGGENAVYPTPKQCRDFLKEVLVVCHQVAMTPDIESEWKKHQSHFARTWLVQMTSRKKVVRLRAADVIIEDFRDQIEQHAEIAAHLDAMLKDVLLLEAACATDSIVVALDDKVRGHFAKICQYISNIGDVIWVNPTIDDEECIIWLRKGAPPDEHRKLSFEPE